MNEANSEKVMGEKQRTREGWVEGVGVCVGVERASLCIPVGTGDSERGMVSGESGKIANL